MVAVDVGTSSVRAILFDRAARPVPNAAVQVPHPARNRRDGAAVIPLDEVEAAIAVALTRLLDAAQPAQVRAIAGVGVSCYWHSLVVTGPTGAPLTPVMLWNDTRSRAAAAGLAAHLDPEAVRQRTGCPIHPGWWPARLDWLRRTRPRLFNRRHRFLGALDAICLRRGGQATASLSMRSATGLWREGAGWDSELLGRLEVAGDQLPESGEWCPPLVSSGGLKRLAEVPWLAAIGDGAAANLGSGCLDPSRRALTVGTSAALRVTCRRPPAALPPGLWRYRLDSESLVVGGSMSSGGNLHAWLLDLLGGDAELERRAARQAPGAHGLRMLPYIAGQRSPDFGLDAAGVIAGLTLATTRADLLRAGMESVAYETARIEQRLDLEFPAPEMLVASGGGLMASPAWLQIMADVTGRRVARVKVTEASARGAAVHALRHLGHRLPPPPPIGAIYEPDPGRGEVYQRGLARHQDLVRRFATEFAMVAFPGSGLGPVGTEYPQG